MNPNKRQLILVGGGHTHALLLRRLIEEPLPGADLTLISDVEAAPYSGMLPGHVAGAYTYDEMHIDLGPLAERAGACFVLDSAVGWDSESREIKLKSRASWVGQDDSIISFNTGSAPDLTLVPGATDLAIPSKPVPQLLDGWHALLKASQIRPDQAVAIVGGGAGGVELALAMRSQLPAESRVTLLPGTREILSAHPKAVRRKLERCLQKAGVNIAKGGRVTALRKDSDSRIKIELEANDRLDADAVFWVTWPAAPKWLRESDLPLDDAGFIRVHPTLEVIGQANTFAVGDVAAIEGLPLPRAGVFAVRMAQPLEANLRSLWAGDTLTNYEPQVRFLSLIGTADGKAIVSRHGWPALLNRTVWTWKDRIDQKFMRQFEAA
ncbi:MAG: FAD-dependent oxidoreductase [Verrucomicrobiota bacterium]